MSALYVRDRRDRYVVLLGDDPVEPSIGFDRTCLVLCKFAHAVGVAAVLTALGNLILHVPVLIADKQVFGINTKRGVAFVQHMLIGLKFAVVQFPRYAVGSGLNASSASHCETSITAP